MHLVKYLMKKRVLLSVLLKKNLFFQSFRLWALRCVFNDKEFIFGRAELCFGFQCEAFSNAMNFSSLEEKCKHVPIYQKSNKKNTATVCQKLAAAESTQGCAKCSRGDTAFRLRHLHYYTQSPQRDDGPRQTLRFVGCARKMGV